LFRFNKESGNFKLIASTNYTKVKLTDTRIQFIKEASPGILWIGTEYGLNWFDTKNNVSKSFLHQIDNKNSLSGNSLQSNAFIQDDDGNLWVGTWSGGLDRIEFTNRDPETAVYKRFRANVYNSDSLNSNNVISLLLDKKYLWIGTFGGGLNRMDLKTNKVKHYTTEDGLANNIIFAILQDENNNLWLSTDRGISKFDPENETFKNYFKTDGLQDDHFFWGAAYKTKKGELFFGGINGMNSFFPSEIIRNSKPPIPVMLDIKLFEKSIDSETPISSLKSLEVNHDNNYISFEYAGLDFIEPGRIQYMIKLEGLDQNWHLIGNRRLTSYSSLAPNKYIFRLKVANTDGIWNEKELNFRLVVKPPWWKKWYSISISIILFLGSFLAFYFIRIRILKNQTQKLEEVVKKRTSVIMDQKQELQIVNKSLYDQKEELTQTLEELKNTQNQLIASEKMASLGILTAGVAHEINNPLNFIMGAYDVLDDYFTSAGEQKDERIPLLLSSIKTGVDRATEIVKGLNQFSRNNETLTENCEINSIIDNCLTMLNNQLKGRINIYKNISNEEIIITGNVGKLHKVFINLLSNASQSIDKNGTITITILKQDKSVIIDISDTGHGISQENLAKITDPFYTTKDPGKGTGLGLSIAYRIIQDHKGKIEFHSELHKGTSVKISLPLLQEFNKF
jgi:signal transduction histidine kinase